MATAVGTAHVVVTRQHRSITSVDSKIISKKPASSGLFFVCGAVV
jgi:hypothetical protein